MVHGDDETLSDPLAATAPASDETAAGPVRVRGPAIAAGTTVGRYVITEQLGAGGMGSVYAANDPELGRRVAIKLLHAYLADMQTRLLREGQAIARLRHPNVVTIHDVGTHNGQLFIAMELVPGTTLRGWLQTRRRWQEICATFAAAGRGLAAAHAAGLVHRDFKPDNVLMGNDGTIVVTDFGLARATGDAPEAAPSTRTATLDATQTGALLGTPYYMSPEQFRGERLEASSDQFSFCIALYEALYAVRPFVGTNVDELRASVLAGTITEPPESDVPAYVRTAVMRGLAREPSARHPSMTALLAALSPPRRSRAWLAVPLVAVAAGGGVVWWTQREHTVTPAVDPCAAAIAPLDQAWSRIDRAKLPVGAEDAAMFDEFAATWRAQRSDACKSGNEHVATCLDKALSTFSAIVKARPPTATEWPALPSLTRCTAGTDADPKIHGVMKPAPSLALLAPSGTQFAKLDRGTLSIHSTETGLLVRDYAVPDAAFVADWHLPDTVVLVSRSLQELLSVDLKSGVVGHSAFSPRAQIVAPDLQNVLVVDAGDVMLESLVAQTPRRLLARIELERQALAYSWSEDSRRIAMLLGPQSAPLLQIFDLRAGTQQQTPLRLRPSGNNLVWHGDGRLLVIAGGVWSLPIDGEGHLGSAPEQRLPPPPPGQRYELIGSNGTRVLARRVTSTFELAKLDGGKKTTVPIAADLRRVRGLTHDGTRIAVECEDDVGWLRLDEQKYMRAGARDDVITPDGDRLLLVHDNELLEVTDNARTTITSLPPSTEKRLLSCAYGGGICVLVSWSGGSAELRTLTDNNLGPPQRTLIPYRFRDIAVSPDGERLAFAGGQPGTVDTLDLTTQGYKQMTLPADAPCGSPTRVAYAPDGTLFVAQICQGGMSRLLQHTGKGTARVVYEGEGVINGLTPMASGAIYIDIRHDDTELVVIDDM